MFLRTLWSSLFLTTLLGVGGGFAQDQDLGERLLRSGERAYGTKSYAEALETWNQLLKQAPASPQAAQALLLMARHFTDVDPQPEAALALLDRLRTDHMKSAAAPAGLLLRGQVLAHRARKAVDLKEAQAEFSRLLDLFPENEVVPLTHLALGQTFLDQGAFGQALSNFTQVLRWDPSSPVAARAQFLTAETLDLVGDLSGCLRMLQGVRDQFPGSPEAEEATWRLNVRVKQRLLKPPLRSGGPWPEGRTKWLKTPTLMGMDGKGNLFLYQDDLDQASRLSQGRLEAAGPAVKSAKALFLTPSGKVGLVSPKVGIVREDIPAPLPLGNLSSPTGACLDRWGNLWVADARAGVIGLFMADGTTRSIPSPGLVAMASLPDGGIAAASDANRSLVFMDEAGQPRQTIPYGKDLPAPFKYVLALASDPIGHLAALVDGDFEGVVLWGPQGQVLRAATYKQLGIAGKFRALALDREGGILLADRSNDLLIRLN
jgi:TolA-binding protein